MLRPFLLSRSGALRDAKNATYLDESASGVVRLTAEIDGIGRARIDLERGSFRPLRIERLEGGEMTLVFGRWDQAPDVPSPGDSVPDQGPGGNPC